MRVTLSIIITLAVVFSLWTADNATAYDVYKDVAYLRGYLGYVVATLPAFLAGAIASYLLAGGS